MPRDTYTGFDEALGVQHVGDDAASEAVAKVAPAKKVATTQKRTVLNTDRLDAQPVAAVMFKTAAEAAELKQEAIAAKWGTSRQNVAKYLDGTLAVTWRDMLALEDVKVLKSLKDQLSAVIAVMEAAAKRRTESQREAVPLSFQVLTLARRLGEVAKRVEESCDPKSPAGPRRSADEKELILESLDKLIEDAQRLRDAVRDEPVEH